MNRKILIFVIFISCACSAQRTERLLTAWEFAKETQPQTMPESGWKTVTIPHDWAITGPFSRDNDLQVTTVWQNGETQPSTKTGRTGGLPYDGIAWYKTTIPSKWLRQGQRTELLFDAAMSEARVFVNGKQVIYWPYGYNAFHVDITPYLNANADNLIAVRLDNKPESSRWYPGSGLYRNVHLIQTATTHIPTWGVQIKTADINNNRAVLSVNTKISAPNAKKVRLLTEIYNEGYMVTSTSRTLKSAEISNGVADIAQTINISWPHLWSPESPTVYMAKFSLYEGKQLVDTYEQPFGIRTIKIVPNEGFYLNGQLRKFQGVCLHHDLGPLGAATYRDAIRHQLTMLHDMGCDAVRTSHNMPAPELVELADSMGFMLMVEPFDEWEWGKCPNGYNRFFEVVEEGQDLTWAERDMINMIHHFRNNPSVVMWSIGNEVPTQCEPEGYKIAKFLQDICTREDGTRPVTCGMDGVDCVLENGFANVMQVVGINYRAHRYEEIYNATPQKLVLGSETASTVSSRGVYKLPAVKDNNDKVCNLPQPGGNSQTNQCTSYDLEYCPWSNIPDDDFRNMDDFPWTIGQFVWTGFDYLGEPSPYDTDAWPSHSSYFGIIDLASIPKDRYYLYRSQWNKRTHTLHILPHWNWQAGDTLPVMVYTDYDEAELFVNGKSQGRQKKLTREQAQADTRWGHVRRYRLIWDDIPFEPGEVKVVAYKDGKVADSAVMKTAKAPFYMELVAKRSGKLTYTTVRIVDIDGNLCPEADNIVEISTSGNGKFLCAANGDATCVVPFQSTRQKAFHGQLTIITEGEPLLTVTSEGLETAEQQL